MYLFNLKNKINVGNSYFSYYRTCINMKHTLVLVRHGESEWNKENRFTGWKDVELSEKGTLEAKAAGELLLKEGYTFDMAYTSYLKRAIRTLWHILDKSNQMYIPIQTSWRLNERHYGNLTGQNKQEAVETYGKENVMMWRRSYDIPPPFLNESSEYYPGKDKKYKLLNKNEIPLGESLKMTSDRFMPIWNEKIVPEIKEKNKKLIIVAHGNSLRALVKYLDNISEEEITKLNIPTGIPLLYELDKNLKPIKHNQSIAPLSGFYLGNSDELKKKINAVKNQTK